MNLYATVLPFAVAVTLILYGDELVGRGGRARIAKAVGCGLFLGLGIVAVLAMTKALGVQP